MSRAIPYTAPNTSTTWPVTHGTNLEIRTGKKKTKVFQHIETENHNNRGLLHVIFQSSLYISLLGDSCSRF